MADGSSKIELQGNSEQGQWRHGTTGSNRDQFRPGLKVKIASAIAATAAAFGIGAKAEVPQKVAGTVGDAAASVSRNIGEIKSRITLDDVNFRQPIKGDEEKRTLVTSLFGENKNIILRSNVTQDENSVVGFMKPGIQVDAQPVLGTVYPIAGNSDYLPEVEINGKKYGRWYKLSVVQTSPGNFEPYKGQEGDAMSVYVSGNSLRMPRPAESTPAGK